jgi:flagellar protein FliO/FliZ
VPPFSASSCHASSALAAGGESTTLNLPSSAPKVDAHQAAGSSSGGGLVRTIVGLAIVIAVIYGLYWVLKQVKASARGARVGPAWRRSPTLPLGPTARCTWCAPARGRAVGVGEHGVTPIRTYGEHEAARSGLLATTSERDRGRRRVRRRTGPRPLEALAGSLDDLRAKTVIK